jgi:[acyl-carrier-protein] S-malonyltransferase
MSSSSLYILCTGQGAQAVGMGKELYDASSSARDVFGRANDILGFDLKGLCFDGPEDRLNQTDISQPAIYVTGVANFRASVAAGKIDPASVTAYAGLSLGEYTALHLAGVFSFDDGLRLVAARGRYMQEAAVAVPSGMVALMGADEAAATKLCLENAEGEVLVPANYNAPGQIVVSGSIAACQRVQKAAEAAGFKATVLKVAGAFHSPLMQAAADRMREELSRIAKTAPAVTVYSNVTAQPHGDIESIRQRLVEQIVSPVRWQQTMQTLISAATPEGPAAGNTPAAASLPAAASAPAPGQKFIELAPGRTLAGLAKRINRRLPVEGAGL